MTLGSDASSDPDVVLREYLVKRIDATGDCWMWTGMTSEGGYGSVRDDRKRQLAAHRVIYQALVGPVDPALHLDHLCRNKKCVNPDHLEPVTRRVNILRGYSPQAMNARQTHCRKAGHPLSGENVSVDRRGYRSCRTCLRERGRVAA